MIQPIKILPPTAGIDPWFEANASKEECKQAALTVRVRNDTPQLDSHRFRKAFASLRSGPPTSCER